MNPFLVFLNAARNLAGMGMKREQVLDFAQREFGELTDLMKSQIDNIYRPKKSVSPKDPDFDDTVVKMKFDDEGKPFNPKDPLKNLSKKDKKADGGRIGLKDGLFPFPMKKDGFLMSPDFDKLTEEQKMYMEGMKIQEKKRQEKLRKLLEKFKESLPENERNIKPVPMPDRALPDTGIKGLASGGRVGFKKGLLASMMEGLSPDGGIFQSIFANRKHPILSTFNATELLSIGEALGPLLGFNEGGRVGLKDGMDRRKFLKIMGGLASLPVLGKFFKGAKVASTAVPAVKEAVTKAPSYFFRLVDKIRRFGKIIDDSVADPRVERTYKYKDYELKEGAYGDPSETIITKKTDMGPNGYKEEQMRFKKGGQTEDGFVADEYEELTARPDMDGKLKDIEEGIDDASEIIEEATKSAPPIKKAAGGLAYMLGE
jgi:hypothetical protein